MSKHAIRHRHADTAPTKQLPVTQVRTKAVEVKVDWLEVQYAGWRWGKRIFKLVIAFCYATVYVAYMMCSLVWAMIRGIAGDTARATQKRRNPYA